MAADGRPGRFHSRCGGWTTGRCSRSAMQGAGRMMEYGAKNEGAPGGAPSILRVSRPGFGIVRPASVPAGERVKQAGVMSALLDRRPGRVPRLRRSSDGDLCARLQLRIRIPARAGFSHCDAGTIRMVYMRIPGTALHRARCCSISRRCGRRGERFHPLLQPRPARREWRFRRWRRKRPRVPGRARKRRPARSAPARLLVRANPTP